MRPGDRELTDAFERHCAQARTHLQKLMAGAGMSEADGWRIVETLHEKPGGSHLVMRPIHRTLLAPPTMECVVAIGESGDWVESGC
jgi:hypothetical protein